MKFKEIDEIRKNYKTKGYETVKFLLTQEPIHNCVLKKYYDRLCRFLSRDQFLRNQAIRTVFEEIFNNLIKRHTNLDIHRSIWIGNFNIDVFIPRLKLVIEIDGPIHTDEIKMRKDEYRDKTLMDFGLIVHHIDNHNINRCAYELKSLLKNPVRLKNTNFLWQKIYIETLAIHLSTLSEEKLIDLMVEIYSIADEFRSNKTGRTE